MSLSSRSNKIILQSSNTFNNQNESKLKKTFQSNMNNNNNNSHIQN
jgi:hypothetical protein